MPSPCPLPHETEQHVRSSYRTLSQFMPTPTGALTEDTFVEDYATVAWCGHEAAVEAIVNRFEHAPSQRRDLLSRAESLLEWAGKTSCFKAEALLYCLSVQSWHLKATGQPIPREMSMLVRKAEITLGLVAEGSGMPFPPDPILLPQEGE